LLQFLRMEKTRGKPKNTATINHEIINRAQVIPTT
jgi:hypothetical protein